MDGVEACEDSMSKKPGKRGRALASGLPMNMLSVLGEMASQSDRGAALIGGEVVSTALLEAIFSASASPDTKQLTTGNGPITTFHSRILIARHFGLISDAIAAQINAIRDVRNHFAHSLEAHDFSEPWVKQKCEMLPLEERANPEETRKRYQFACIRLASLLLEVAISAPARRSETTLSDLILASPELLTPNTSPILRMGKKSQNNAQ